jgi:hypothetical protein
MRQLQDWGEQQCNKFDWPPDQSIRGNTNQSMKYEHVNFKYRTSLLGDQVEYQTVPFTLALEVGLVVVATPSRDMYKALINNLRPRGESIRCTPWNGWCISKVSFKKNIQLALDFSGLFFQPSIVQEIIEAFRLDPKKQAQDFRSYRENPKEIMEHLLLTVAMEYALGARIIFINWDIDACLLDETLLERLEAGAVTLNLCVIYNINNQESFRFKILCKYLILIFTQDRLVYEGKDPQLAIELLSHAKDTQWEDKAIKRALFCRANSQNEIIENTLIIESFTNHIKRKSSPPNFDLITLVEKSADICEEITFIRRKHPVLKTTLIIFKHRMNHLWANKLKFILLMINIPSILILDSFVYFQLQSTQSTFTTGVISFFTVFSVYSFGASGGFSCFRIALEEYRRYSWIPTLSIVVGETLAIIFPIRLPLLIISLTAQYYISGFRTDKFIHVFVYLTCLTMLFLLATSIGTLTATLVRKIRHAESISVLSRTLYQVFNRSPNYKPRMTWVLLWITYIDPTFYVRQCLLSNEFTNRDLPKYEDTIQEDQGRIVLSVAACLSAIAGFWILFEAMTIVSVHFVRKSCLNL